MPASVWNDLLRLIDLPDDGVDGSSIPVECRSVPGAGRGLFALRDIDPKTPLFRIPSSSLLNIRTLAPLYRNVAAWPAEQPEGSAGSQLLNSTQALCLHLFLHGHDSEDAFASYINSLPQEFGDHPLAWAIKANEPDLQLRSHLVDLMPPPALRKLGAVEKRFTDDWAVVQKYTPERLRKDDEALKTFLWAWLNGNTRCIYHPITKVPSPPYDLTLCPIVDLANHTVDPLQTCELTRFPIGDRNPEYLTFLSPSVPLKQGDQLFLRYGPHSNEVLFTEYGFVAVWPDEEGEISVDDIVEALFLRDEVSGDWKKSSLENWNYWGEWDLHSHPKPAHPSYRLLPALRLLHSTIPLPLPPASKPHHDNDFDPDTTNPVWQWESTLMGFTEIISEENEALVRRSLAEICTAIITRAEEGLRRVNHFVEGLNEKKSDFQYGVECITTLWEEEAVVADVVLKSVQEGVEF